MRYLNTLYLNRILSFLAENRNDNDITYDEIYEVCALPRKDTFNDGMKFLIQWGIIKQVKIGDKFYYHIVDRMCPKAIAIKQEEKNENESNKN
jgi:hypothetical protein